MFIFMLAQSIFIFISLASVQRIFQSKDNDLDRALMVFSCKRPGRPKKTETATTCIIIINSAQASDIQKINYPLSPKNIVLVNAFNLVLFNIS